jgi:hypothetical protein
MQGVRYRLLRRTLLPQIRVFRWVDPALEDVHKRASVAEEEGVVFGTHRDRVRITLFEGEVFQIAGENLSQSIDGGDATSLVSTNDLRVITPLDRLEVLLELNLGTALVTPNGDGIHDRLELAYTLHGVSAADVEAGVYDLAGRLVHRLAAKARGQGRIRWRSIVLTSSDLCVRQHWQAR